MIRSLIRLTRPYYTVPLTAGLPVIAAYVAGGRPNAAEGSLLWAMAALWSVLSAAYALNDYCDIRFDAVNSPHRPLPDKEIAPGIALAASGGLFAAGLALASLCGLPFFLLLTLVAVGLAAYDVYSKRLGLLKPLAVALLTTSLYPMAFAIQEPADTPRLCVLAIHPVWLLMTTLGYEMLKDIRDVPGDRAVGSRREAERRAEPGFLLAARAILLAASLLTLLPYALGYCKEVYLLSAIGAIGLVALAIQEQPLRAIPYVYASVVVITAGSLADLWAYGP